MIGGPEDLMFHINVSQKMRGNVYKLKRKEFVNIDDLTKKKAR